MNCTCAVFNSIWFRLNNEINETNWKIRKKNEDQTKRTSERVRTIYMMCVKRVPTHTEHTHQIGLIELATRSTHIGPRIQQLNNEQTENLTETHSSGMLGTSGRTRAHIIHRKEEEKTSNLIISCFLTIFRNWNEPNAIERKKRQRTKKRILRPKRSTFSIDFIIFPFISI